MKNQIYFLILALLLTFSCQKKVSQFVSNLEPGYSEISFYLSKSTLESKAISYVNAIVSASDMDTIFADLTVTDSLVIGTIENIPAGIQRKFELFAYDSLMSLIYYGSDFSDVVANTTITLNITLYPVNNTGTVIIIGSFGNTQYQNEKILFESYTNGLSDICMINPDGSGFRNLTNDNFDNREPCLSSDLNKIVYKSYLNDLWRIFILDLRTMQKYELNVLPGFNCGYPRWSPDGKKIAFHARSDDNQSSYEIYTVNANGSNLSRLTENVCKDIFPNWAPDGSKLAFFTDREGLQKVYVVNSDGTDEHRLNYEANLDEKIPTWTPDGNQIVFYARDISMTWDLFIINSNGTNLIQLTNTPNIDENHQCVSPDGSKIIFSRATSYSKGIYTVNLDGTDLKEVIDTSADEDYPYWALKNIGQ